MTILATEPGGPGGSVAVYSDGQIVFAKGYGLAERGKGVPATPTTNYYLASVTKQFTGMAVMMLKEDGQLGFDDPLRQHFPEFPRSADSVTVRHLLHHTSGLADYFKLIPKERTEPVTSADVVRLLAAAPAPDFPPGSKYEYSNSGYVVLGQLVERVSGKTYAAFLEERMLTPLGMLQSVVFDALGKAVPERAYGYVADGDSFQVRDEAGDPLFAIVGDGGLYSSVVDMYKWDQALYTESLVSAATLKDAYTPGILSDGSTIPYGFGWRLGADAHGRFVTHGGAYAGFGTAFLRYPDRKWSVVVLTNRRESDGATLARAVADRFLG